MFNSIKGVVEQYLCTQCGTCVSVCPSEAIEMQETPSGMLTPLIQEEKCVRCGECLELCPGLAVEMKLPKHVDPFRGEVCAAYVGYACDHLVRSTGQSGGVVSALLIYLLESGQIDAALVTAMPADGSLRPAPMIVKKRSDILAAQGSKYCPAATNSVLKDITFDDHIATVGIPCQIQGIHKLAQEKNALTRNINFKIGLFCDRTLLYTCIDMMAEKAEVDRAGIAGLRYRSKTRNGWPGEVCFQLNSGHNRYFPSSLRILLKDYFTPPRCRLCFDKMNILSDISIGDAYGISEGPKGDSVVIARNDKAVSIINDACNSGFLKLRQIDAESIFKAQNIEQRRSDFTAYLNLWRKMGHSVPQYMGLDPRFLSSVDFKARIRCRQNILLNYRVAKSTTRQSALSIVRTYQRREKMKDQVLKPFRKFKRFLN